MRSHHSIHRTPPLVNLASRVKLVTPLDQDKTNFVEAFGSRSASPVMYFVGVFIVPTEEQPTTPLIEHSDISANVLLKVVKFEKRRMRDSSYGEVRDSLYTALAEQGFSRYPTYADLVTKSELSEPVQNLPRLSLFKISSHRRLEPVPWPCLDSGNKLERQLQAHLSSLTTHFLLRTAFSDASEVYAQKKLTDILPSGWQCLVLAQSLRSNRVKKPIISDELDRFVVYERFWNKLSAITPNTSQTGYKLVSFYHLTDQGYQPLLISDKPSLLSEVAYSENDELYYLRLSTERRGETHSASRKLSKYPTIPDIRVELLYTDESINRLRIVSGHQTVVDRMDQIKVPVRIFWKPLSAIHCQLAEWTAEQLSREELPQIWTEDFR